MANDFNVMETLIGRIGINSSAITEETIDRNQNVRIDFSVKMCNLD